MNKNKAGNYESPLLIIKHVELEQTIAASGKAKVKLNTSDKSTEEDWTDLDTGGNYDLDM